MSVAVSSGSSLVQGRKLFSVPPVEQRKSKLSTPEKANAYPGMVGSLPMMSPLWMMMAGLCCLVSGVVGILIVSIHLI